MTRSEKIKEIKNKIKKGTFDWDKAIEETAKKIVENPESLLWR